MSGFLHSGVPESLGAAVELPDVPPGADAGALVEAAGAELDAPAAGASDVASLVVVAVVEPHPVSTTAPSARQAREKIEDFTYVASFVSLAVPMICRRNPRMSITRSASRTWLGPDELRSMPPCLRLVDDPWLREHHVGAQEPGSTAET